MLSYPSQLEVLRFLGFEKRCHLAQSSPKIRPRHRKLPFYFKSVSIEQYENNFYLLIEDFNTWIYENRGFTWIRYGEFGEVRKVDCDLEQASDRVLDFYFGRKGTIIEELEMRGQFQIPRHIPNFHISSLDIFSDDPIHPWFHVIKGNYLRKVRIHGQSIFELLNQKEILECKNVTVVTTTQKIQNMALTKLIKSPYLRCEFYSFVGKYYTLSEEIQEISQQNRPIGAIIDYFVHDYLRYKLYPYFPKLIEDLNAKWTDFRGLNVMTVPMKNGAELYVYIVPGEDRRSWILRMEVMESNLNE